MVAVDGKSFGEEVGWVEDGAEVWEKSAIPCIGNTADQAVSTVYVQLGATKHLN